MCQEMTSSDPTRRPADVAGRTVHTVELSEWLVAELDSVRQRIIGQVWDPVPDSTQTVALDRGNSIVWSTFHVARHAALALAVLGVGTRASEDALAALPAVAAAPDSGLHEVQRGWIGEFEPEAVRTYSSAVLDETRSYLTTVSPELLAAPVPIDARLRARGLGAEFDWLVGQWAAGGVQHLIRWPLLGHVTNHVGEMIATRNQLGFSPYR